MACKEKLAGPGDREAAIRTPLEELLGSFGKALKLKAVFHDEVRDEDRRVRPDYGVSIQGAISGYVEVKAPGRSIDPTGFRGHDREQWERQRDLPNLLYTNGTEWRLFRDGEAIGEPVRLTGGSLEKAGGKLAAPVELEGLLTNFLRWKPAPITSVTALVRAVAPLTRLLRSEVLEQLASEHKAVEAGDYEHDQPFLGLASDWRRLLFPAATDEVFADGYAQTITFALLLARSDGIELDGAALHIVGDKLGAHHSLMGRALQLLTDTVAADFKVTLDLLVRVIGAVDWPKVRGGKRDTYLHLYENFLEEYDPDLRQESGSYYTPTEVVDEMVRLTDEVLKDRLGKQGFSDKSVTTIDPAMGTGTFLQAIIKRVSDEAEASFGPGVVRGYVTDLAERLVGFEIQTGPYAVAELRTSDLLRASGAKPPRDGMHLYVTDTLDDPYAEIEQLASGLGAISDSRRKANIVKRETPVTVVIGNPPYRERAEGMGGWVEMGSEGGRQSPKRHRHAVLDGFRAKDNGMAEYVLKNLYVYFWRWAAWKVFDAIAEERAGVICFITTSGYVRGPGFKGMREYLRRTCSEGWIIDVSPEGMRPDVPTRLFPGVQQPLAIGIFVRRSDETDAPATIHHTTATGRRAEKHKALSSLKIDGKMWREARSDWQAPFTPAADSDWDDYPALSDLMPWVAPGVKPNKTWVYAPTGDLLDERWIALVAETNPSQKQLLFRETTDTSLSKAKRPLRGSDTHRFEGPFSTETGSPPSHTRVGYRAFDRQWLIPDSRLLHRPSPDLWDARIKDQLFAVEQHAKPLSDGPGILFSSLIPDMDYFKGSEGGRVLPLLHPDGSPNLAPALSQALFDLLNAKVDASDIAGYIAAVTAHPAFTRHFADELTTPGIRVPLTTDPALWNEAVALGRQVIWLHTYGASFADGDDGRPSNDIRFEKGDPRQPLSMKPVTEMPEQMSYDIETQTLRLGKGEWGPVRPEAIDYEVGGRNVLKSWFNYRKKEPGGKRSSPLDDINVESWPSDWTVELIELLTVLTRLVELEPAQADLLNRILTGPILTKDQLEEKGVSWPLAKKDRAPRRAAFGGGSDHQPTLG